MATACKLQRKKNTKKTKTKKRASTRSYNRRRTSRHCVCWDDDVILLQPPSPESATTPVAANQEELLQATAEVLDVSQLDFSAPVLDQIVQQVTDKTLSVAEDILIHQEGPHARGIKSVSPQSQATENVLHAWLTSQVLHRLEMALLNVGNYQSGGHLASVIAGIIWEELGTTLVGVVTQAGQKVAALLKTESPHEQQDTQAAAEAAAKNQQKAAVAQAIAQAAAAKQQAKKQAAAEEEQARMAAEQAAAQAAAEDAAEQAAAQAAREEVAQEATQNAFDEALRQRMEQAAAEQAAAQAAREQVAQEATQNAFDEALRQQAAAAQAAREQAAAAQAAEQAAARAAREEVAREEVAQKTSQNAFDEALRQQAAAAQAAREQAAAQDAREAAAQAEAEAEALHLKLAREAAAQGDREDEQVSQCQSHQQVPLGQPTTHGFAVVDYKDKIYRTGQMLSYDVPGDGLCFYHAVAACLRASAHRWSEIEKDETNLCSVLHDKLNIFRNVSNNGSTVNVDSTFIQWLAVDFLETVSADHPLFTNTSVEGTPILVADEISSSENAFTPAQMIERIHSPCVQGWGGRQEAFVLHYALKGLVTVMMMHANVGSDGLTILSNASNSSHQDDDRAFIFLEHTNSNHWRALSFMLHDEVSEFIVPLPLLQRQHELTNKCMQKGSIPGNILKQNVPYTDGKQLEGVAPAESDFYVALAIALHITKLDNSDKWNDAMCRALKHQYDRFQLTHADIDPSSADTMFMKYLSRDSTDKESIFSVMDAVEDALDNLCRINLHRRWGIVKRPRPRRLDHAATTYELNVYQEGDAKIVREKIAPRYNMYLAINRGQEIQSDKDQAYVTKEGYTAPSAIAVLSGVFRAAQPLPPAFDVMGYLGSDDMAYTPNKTKKTEDYGIVADACNPSNIQALSELPGQDAIVGLPAKLYKCGISNVQLVETKHRLQLPVTRETKRTLWKTLAGRQLNRFDFLYLLLSSGKYDKHPSATTFFLCNGIIWKFVLVNASAIAQQEPSNLLGSINEVFDSLDQPDDKVSIDSKLQTMLEFLGKTGIQGTAAIIKYSGIGQEYISPSAKDTAQEGFFSSIFGGRGNALTTQHYQDISNRLHRRGKWS